MTVKSIPDTDHVVHYVGWSLLLNGRVDGNAFVRRTKEQTTEPTVSVNWLEVFGHDRTHQLAEVRRCIHLKLGAQAKFALLQTGASRRHVARSLLEDGYPQLQMGFVHAPRKKKDNYPDDPSHAGITGLPDPGADPEHAEYVGDLIAQSTIALYPARA
jgi:hypothetical protein